MITEARIWEVFRELAPGTPVKRGTVISPIDQTCDQMIRIIIIVEIRIMIMRGHGVIQPIRMSDGNIVIYQSVLGKGLLIQSFRYEQT